MIDAKEAREIMAGAAEFYLNEIEGYIKKAAQKGESNIIIYDRPYCWWLHHIWAMPDEAKEVFEQIESLGYEINPYEEKDTNKTGLMIGW